MEHGLNEWEYDVNTAVMFVGKGLQCTSFNIKNTSWSVGRKIYNDILTGLFYQPDASDRCRGLTTQVSWDC